MSEKLRLCSVCNKGHMRPLSKIVDYSEANRAEGSSFRGYECDNDDCKHKELSEGLYESH